MSRRVTGIHHVTCVCNDPQQNVNFYSGILGLRLVKKTVNFDVPDTYHLYYGDAAGNPGTILTFFSWPDAPQGMLGSGQVSTTAFAIPQSSLGYWRERLAEHGVVYEEQAKRFGEPVLAFKDHDGLPLELIGSEPDGEGSGSGTVPAAHTIRGFHSVTLLEAQPEQTYVVLEKLLGFDKTHQEGQRTRSSVAVGGFAATVDVQTAPGTGQGMVGIGSVHHVAWRTPSDEEQLAWREFLTTSGLPTTNVRDRQYFHSIYFNEPGGVLFEIATDPPGFAIDEDPTELGTHLKLPPWLEQNRPQLEEALPPLRIPEK
jgi:catechol 2,3-dioxygenase-like lactoylglutathione lyase family enzyme